MLFLVMLFTACQPDSQAISVDILASPEFQAAVEAAVAKKTEATAGETAGSAGGDLQAMAACLSTYGFPSSNKGPTKFHRIAAKRLNRCGRIGLGTEPPEK